MPFWRGVGWLCLVLGAIPPILFWLTGSIPLKTVFVGVVLLAIGFIILHNVNRKG